MRDGPAPPGVPERAWGEACVRGGRRGRAAMRERGLREPVAEQSLSLARVGSGDLVFKRHRAVAPAAVQAQVGPKLRAGSRDLCLCHHSLGMSDLCG